MLKDDPQARENFLNAMRAALEFFETRPDMPVPNYGCTFNMFCDSKEQLLELRKLAGECDKVPNDHYIILRKEFGYEMRLDLNLRKEYSCKQVKTGERIVPAQPAREAQPERVEEVFEWVCEDSLLKSISERVQ